MSQVLNLKKVAIYDPVADESHVFSGIIEGVDEAANFWYSVEPQTINIEDNQLAPDRLNHTFNVRVLPETGVSSFFDNIIQNERDVYISAVGIDGGFFMGDFGTSSRPVKLTYAKKYDGAVESYKIEATRSAPWGYDLGTGLYSGGVWSGQNLIGNYSWADNDGDGLANGWSETGFTSVSFSAGQQTLEAGTTPVSFANRIVFPFEGEQVTLSINIDSITGDYSENTIRIVFLDSSGSSISPINDHPITSTGRVSLTLTVPEGTVQLSAQVRMSSNTGTVINEVSDPMLRVGASTEYTPN